MRLVAQSRENWQYHLERSEADILAGLLKKFPLTELIATQISTTGKGAETVERNKLLNESLAEHRKELAKLAANLLVGDKWQRTAKGHLLTLDGAAREVLLQILNDIRVGCWRALGEPESLEIPLAATSPKSATHRNLMDLAGYFEMNLLEPES
jgi:hypothetical protein